MKLSYLWRGLPGHPLHPPLTDATLGTYTFATVAALAEVVGITENAGAYGWWIALIAGLIFTVPTALTGFADWLTIAWRSDLWWTATYHLLSMVTATIFFALAAIVVAELLLWTVARFVPLEFAPVIGVAIPVVGLIALIADVRQ